MLNPCYTVNKVLIFLFLYITLIIEHKNIFFNVFSTILLLCKILVLNKKIKNKIYI